MELLISVSAVKSTAAILKKKIKCTETYRKLMAAISELVAGIAIARKQKKTKAAIDKMVAKKNTLREKARAYKEANGAYISRKSVSDLQKELKATESAKPARTAGGRKPVPVVNRTGDKTQKRISFLEAQLKSLQSKLRAGQKHVSNTAVSLRNNRSVQAQRDEITNLKDELKKLKASTSTPGMKKGDPVALRKKWLELEGKKRTAIRAKDHKAAAKYGAEAEKAEKAYKEAEKAAKAPRPSAVPRTDASKALTAYKKAKNAYEKIMYSTDHAEIASRRKYAAQLYAKLSKAQQMQVDAEGNRRQVRLEDR